MITLSLLLALLAPQAAIPPYAEPVPDDDVSRPEPLPQERGALPHLGRAMQAGDAKEAITNYDLALVQLPQPSPFRGMVQCMRGVALMQDEQPGPAQVAIDECHRLLPDHPAAQMTRAMAYHEARDYVRAAPLIAAAMRGDPSIAVNLDTEFIDTILGGLGYARRDDLREQLITVLIDRGFARDDAPFFSSIARQAVLYRVLKKDNAGAVALLPQITNPADGLMMLIDREFEPIWPYIEEWAHNDLSVQRDMFVRQARARAAVHDTVQDRVALTAILEANGARDEARDLLRRIVADKAAWDDFRFHAALAATRLSRMLAEDGETNPDVVIAPMQTVLGDQPITPETGGLNTLPPNLARRLILQRRFDRAMTVIDRYTPKSEDIMFDEDIGYMVAMRVCALTGKGDAARAAEVRASLMTDYATNRSANGMAAACAGDMRDYTSMMKRSITERRTRSAALLAMAQARVRLDEGQPAERESLGGSAVDAVYRDPEIVAAFEKHGRMLPASFLPALKQWQLAKPLDAAQDGR